MIVEIRIKGKLVKEFDFPQLRDGEVFEIVVKQNNSDKSNKNLGKKYIIDKPKTKISLNEDVIFKHPKAEYSNKQYNF